MNLRDKEKILKEVIKVSNKKKLGIWGVSEESQELFQYLKRHDIEISMFVALDLPFNKQLLGVPVISLKDYERTDYLNTVIISAEQLSDHESNQIKYVCKKRNKLILSLLKVVKFFKDYKVGYGLYNSLQKRYGETSEIIVFQGKSGDLYNASVYLSNYYNKDIVLLVIGQACLSTAQLFSFDKVEKISLYEAECLVKLYYLFGENCGIKPLHCSQRYLNSSIFTNLQHRAGMTLGKMYKYYVLDLPEDIKPNIPLYPRNDQYIKELIEKSGLQINNSVILSPYANSYMDDQLVVFWEKLAWKLKNRGYKVYTNSASAAEPAIKNTDIINFNLLDAGYVLEKAGIFIALRSGFCDITASAKCKKIIIYKKNIWKSADFYEFHSLKNLELSDDSVEIVYDYEHNNWEDELLSQILGCIE